MFTKKARDGSYCRNPFVQNGLCFHVNRYQFQENYNRIQCKGPVTLLIRCICKHYRHFCRVQTRRPWIEQGMRYPRVPTVVKITLWFTYRASVCYHRRLCQRTFMYDDHGREEYDIRQASIPRELTSNATCFRTCDDNLYCRKECWEHIVCKYFTDHRRIHLRTILTVLILSNSKCKLCQDRPRASKGHPTYS